MLHELCMASVANLTRRVTALLPSGRNASALRHCPGPMVAARSSMLPAMELCPLAMRDRCKSGLAEATICMHTTARTQAALGWMPATIKGYLWLVHIAQHEALHPKHAKG